MDYYTVGIFFIMKIIKFIKFIKTLYAHSYILNSHIYAYLREHINM